MARKKWAVSETLSNMPCRFKDECVEIKIKLIKLTHKLNILESGEERINKLED